MRVDTCLDQDMGTGTRLLGPRAVFLFLKHIVEASYCTLSVRRSHTGLSTGLGNQDLLFFLSLPVTYQMTKKAKSSFLGKSTTDPLEKAL